MIKRKIISFLKLFSEHILIFIRITLIKIFVQNIILEKGVKIGKNVKIKTTDEGKIIIKKNTCIENNVLIYAQNSRIIINENTFIGYGTQIVSKESIVIGDNCLIAAYCTIRDANHGIRKDQRINQQSFIKKGIKIGNDVWIGTHVTINKGIILHNGIVVGANSVVTKEFPEYCIIGGIPAKIIKYRI